MAVAATQDVAVALGRPIASDAEEAQIDWWLTGVELIIGARLGDVADLDQDLLLYVEVEAVVAKVRRRDSRVSSETVSVDDASVTQRFESSVSLADITDEWWGLLNPATGSSFYSTRPTFEADDVWHAVTTPPAWPEDEPGWT